MWGVSNLETRWACLGGSEDGHSEVKDTTV